MSDGSDPPSRRRSLQTLWALSGARLRGAAEKARLIFTEDPGRGVQVKAEVAGARSLLRSAQELKGGAAKVAQLVAYLEGPEGLATGEARAVLQPLFDHVEGGDPAGIRRVVTEDLGAAPEEVFAAWDAAPFAAASLGEVHGARGRDGADLAVKVQYPGVAEALAADLQSGAVVQRLVGAAMGGAVPVASQEAIRAAVAAEVDYLAEAAHQDQFRLAFLPDAQVVVPRPRLELCKRRVLTADRLRGVSLLEFARTASVAARGAVAEVLFRFGFGGPICHGLLNADPNPGNYLILDQGQRVGFVDFGCCVELSEDLLTCERVMWQALLAQDGESLRYSLYRAGLVREMIELDSDRYRAWERCLAQPFVGRAFTWTPGYARELATHTSQLVRGGRFSLPPAAILLWRQRLGLLFVLGQLGGRGDFRAALLQLLRSVDMAPVGVQ